MSFKIGQGKNQGKVREFWNGLFLYEPCFMLTRLTRYWIEMDRVLTHWGRDKMATISHATFSNAFFNENVSMSTKILLKFIPTVTINTIPALVQIMTLRRPVIVLTNGWLDYRRTYASLGLNELKCSNVLVKHCWKIIWPPFKSVGVQRFPSSLWHCLIRSNHYLF